MKKLLYILVALVLIFASTAGFLGHIFSEKSARILFVGDMMFDRTIRAKAEASPLGYDMPFSCMSEYLKTFDVVTANLEGSITKNSSLSRGTNPGEAHNTAFTFSPDVAPALFKNNIRMINAGNNHSVDFGYAGAKSTRDFLLEAGVSYFGSPQGSVIATTTVNGLKLAFINFNQFLGLNNPQKTVDAITGARAHSDLVFVYTHWGTEYAPATDDEKALARKFILAGADMVIGSHPHIIQEHEIYKGKHIFYSLGNFIFDQYWNSEVQTGAVVEVQIVGKKLEVTERRVELKRNGTTCLSPASI